MRFETKNNMRLFNFEEVTLKEIKIQGESIIFVLDALIVKGNNPVNEECVDRFSDTANLRFVNGHIEKIVKEGFKYYNADGKLLDEKEDEVVPLPAYDSFLKKCVDIPLYDVVALKEMDGDRMYQLGFDMTEDDTYWIDISCTETVIEWEKFKNRVMY